MYEENALPFLKIQTHFTTTKTHFSGVIAMSFYYGICYNII